MGLQMQPQQREVDGGDEQRGRVDVPDAVRVLDGYFRRHAPYAKTKTAERLFAAWARGDPMVEAMLRAVVAADHA